MRLLQNTVSAICSGYKKILPYGIIVLCAIGSLYGIFALEPTITDSTYRIPVIQPSNIGNKYRIGIEQDKTPFTFPLDIHTNRDRVVHLEWSFEQSILQTKKYLFIPDDCLQFLKINSVVVNDAQLPFCDIYSGKTIDLSNYLIEGKNTVEAWLYNSGGTASLTFKVSPQDTFAHILQSLFYLSIIVFFWKLCSIKIFGLESVRLRIPIVLGIFLRMHYFTVTTFWEREHDVYGHIQYIELLMKNIFTLPSISDGWVLYHPPLYYIFAALWGNIVTLFTTSHSEFLRLMQVQSVIFSIIFLFLCVWLSKLIFIKTEEVYRSLFIALCATFAGLLFFAARINNDVLVVLLQLLCVITIVYWWQNTRMKYWYIALCIACLAILTKTSSLLLLPILGICLLFSGKPLRKIVYHAFFATCIVACLTGWFFYIRFILEASRDLAGNIHNLNSVLRIPNSPEIIIQFNPLRIIRDPYVDLLDPYSGREFFWEYWWKTALFAASNYGSGFRILASTIATLSMTLLLLCIRGVIQSMRNWDRKYLPLMTTGAVFLFGHVVYRFLAPFSVSQDFRYSAISILPILYFTILGLSTLSKNRKFLAICGLILFISAQSVFFIYL